MSQFLVRTGVERAGEADAGREAELRGVLVDDLHDPSARDRDPPGRHQRARLPSAFRPACAARLEQA
jgi:hypothetical protein